MAKKYDLVLIIRFLHRPFLARVAQVLNPGGVVVLFHFDEGALEFGRPTRAKHVLGTGEGRRVLEEAGMKVLVEEKRVIDDGRPM